MKKRLQQQLKVMACYGLIGICLQCLLLNIVLASDGNAQDPESIRDILVDVSGKDMRLKEVFKRIEKQTTFEFSYDAAFVDDTERISINMVHEPLINVLEQVAKEKHMSFKRVDNTIFVKKSEEEGEVEEVVKVAVPITGKVTSAENGEPLPGVSVMVKDTNIGAVTDMDGNYSLDVPDENNILVFSFIGFTMQEVSINGRKTLDVVLAEDVQSLEEVVIIGYGTQKKRDLTGAISSVKADELTIVSTPDIGRALKGKLAGLMVRENSAQPGGGLDILIRGAGSINASNAPLIVVDGFPIADLQQPNSGGRYNAGSHSILNSFNPNDIESIEVLKDASATAIYGARAANGVILITTRQGKEGKPIVQYSVNLSSQKYKDSYDLLGAEERLIARNEGHYENWLFDNNVYPFGTRTLAEAEADPTGGIPYQPLYTPEEIANAGRGTDWFDLIIRRGSIQQHNLTVSGGTSSTKYMVSGNYYDHAGIIKNSRLKRYTVRTNVDQKINDFLKVGLNLTASQTTHNNSQLGDGRFENSGIIRAAVEVSPHIKAMNDDGSYPRDPLNPLRPNPYSLLTITDQGRVERLLLNTYAEVKPLQNLVFYLKAGVDRGATKRWNYLPRTTLHGAADKGRASIAGSDQNSYLYEATGSYTVEPFAGHSFSLMLGTSNQRFENSSESIVNTTFFTDEFLWYNIGSGKGFPRVGSSGSRTEFMSYFGRFNYNFRSRYLLTLTLRADGASVFSRNNKWGTFPSVAVGWNIAEERFFEPLKQYLSQLKVRISHGQTGNASIGNSAFAAYRARNAWLNGEDQTETGVVLTRLENPNLKWETTTETNLGLDVTMFNGRVDASFEYYNKVISDLLNTHSLNSYHIINSITANIGETQSRGLEATINTVNIERQDFRWRSSLSLGAFRDTWKTRAADWKPAVYQSDKDPIRPMYYRVSDGIMQPGETAPDAQPDLRPGMIKIKDIDGFLRGDDGNPVVTEEGRFMRTGEPDGIIDNADYRLLGSSDPGLILGFSNTFRYKRFDLQVDFNGMLGRTMADPTYTTYGVGAGGSLRTVLNRWTPDNPSTEQPGSMMGRSTYGVGDFFLQDASFIRLQNVSLGYDIPVVFFKKLINEARINVNVNNLFVLTPYTGIDPETDSYTTPYPNVRTFAIGLNIKF